MSRHIYIRLTPKAAHNKIGELRQLPNGQQELCVYVTAPPDKNKANEAMIKLLANHFKVATSQIRLTGGSTSRHKIIHIEG